jgi:zinc protease
MAQLRWLRFAFVLIAVLLAGSVPARELQTLTAWPHQTGDIKPDPNVIWGQLDNGMRYVLLPNSTPKDRVSLRLLVSAGSLMEREDQRGLAHLLEHMAFKGSDNMPAGDLVQYLERLGMAFGADTNARTGFESTVYQLELPNNSQDMIDRSLFVLREKADHLRIPQAELDKERGVVLSEKRLRDTADYRAFEASMRFMLPETPVADRVPIGVESVVANASRERLLEFYRTYYTPNRTTLVAVGAIDPTQFIELLKRNFASFHASGLDASNPDIGRVPARGLETKLHYDVEGHASVALQAVKPLPPEADTRERRQRELDLYVANSIISRRLATAALKPDAGFLNGGAQSDDFLGHARIGVVMLNTEPDQWRKALSVGEAELRRALTYGFTVGELEEQKKNLMSEFMERDRAGTTRESHQLADELVQNLTEGRVFTSPDQDLLEITDGLAKVTPNTALEALRTLWSNAGPLIFVSGPIKLDNADATIAQVYRASESQPVTPPAENAVQSFAYTDFGVHNPILERNQSKVLDVTQIRFGNNVRLNLKPTKFEANSVSIAVRFGGGRLQLPLDKPGLKQLAESTFLAGGLEKHSLDDLNRIIAGRTVGLGFDVEDDAFVLGGHTTPGDLLLQLQLLAAYVVAPGYRPEALDKFRQGLPQLYKSLDRTPGGILQKDVTRFLRSGDPRFGYPAQAVLASRTLEELRALLQQPLANGYLEISLVGDFDVDSAVQAVETTFGSLPTREASKPAYKQERTIHFPASRELAVFPYETTDPKGLTVVYWPTTDFSQVTEVRRLFVLAKLLGNRVLERVRNEQGLTYTAQGEHAPSQAFPGYGFLYAMVDAPPDKARALASEIRAIGGALYTNGMTQDELERARNPVVSELKRLLSTNAYLLTAIVSGSQEQPLKLARAVNSVPELESLTVDDLKSVAHKYLMPEAALPVIIVPSQTIEKTSGAAREAELALTE